MAAEVLRSRGQVWFPHAAEGAWAHVRALFPAEQLGTSKTREQVNIKEAGERPQLRGGTWCLSLGHRLRAASESNPESRAGTERPMQLCRL